MNLTSELFRSDLIGITRFAHPPGHVHRDPSEERADAYSISFVERGWFELRSSRSRWEVSPDHLFLTRPGFAYRCRHKDDFPTDECLSVEYEPAFAEELSGAMGFRRGWASPVAAVTNRVRYLFLRLSQALTEGSGAAEIQTLAGDLFGATAQQANGTKLHSARQIRWYTERVETARRMIEREYATDLSLARISRDAGMSPFHFSRVFRELVGTPPHRYLLDVRLSQAAAMLGKGVTVTQTCFDCGFANLSHFVRLFSRKYGAPPARFTRAERGTIPIVVRGSPGS